MEPASRSIRLLPLVAIMVHALLCPYTKVEESFNLQAVHDLLYRGMRLDLYDHLEFPGVVPRTFLAPIALTAATLPAAVAQRALGVSRAWTQLAVRLCLGGASAAALARVGRGVDGRFGRVAGSLFALICACQFHLPFYASRTLPNTFALLFTNASLSLWLDGSADAALLALVPAIVCLRAELLLWLAPLGLWLLAQRAVRFWAVLRRGVALGLVSLALSLLVDSAFWRRPLWPEGEVLFFNTLYKGPGGQSHLWGTSPFHWYFTSALPRALLGAAPLALVGAVCEPRARPLVAVPLAFVTAYSLLPHKELRFIIYAVPSLNVAAALGAARLLGEARAPRSPGSPASDSAAKARRGHPSRSRRWVARLALLGLAGVTVCVTAVMSAASRANYPAAHALAALHAAAPRCSELRELRTGPVRRDGAVSAPSAATGGARCCSVHIDAAAAMTGVSLFLQDDARFNYSKQEGAVRDHDFTHLLTARERVSGFTLLHVQEGFARLQRWPPRIRTAPMIYVHENERTFAARRR